jgi:pyridoxal phosphate enzyme (YggS family)
MLVKNTTAIMKRLSRATMKSDRIPDDIEFIAATGSVDIPELKAAADISFRFFGSASVQDAKNKKARFREVEKAEKYSGVQWHLTGSLCNEGIKDAVALFDLIHTVDSLALAEAINREAERTGKVQRILVRVRLFDTAAGVSEQELLPLLERIKALGSLKLEGLMTSSPASADPARSRPHFSTLRELRDKAVQGGFSLPHLSMGISHDFEIGIEEGATLVQVDDILFIG